MNSFVLNSFLYFYRLATIYTAVNRDIKRVILRVFRNSCKFQLSFLYFYYFIVKVHGMGMGSREI